MSSFDPDLPDAPQKRSQQRIVDDIACCDGSREPSHRGLQDTPGNFSCINDNHWTLKIPGRPVTQLPRGIGHFIAKLRDEFSDDQGRVRHAMRLRLSPTKQICKCATWLLRCRSTARNHPCHSKQINREPPVRKLLNVDHSDRLNQADRSSSISLSFCTML